MFDYTYQLYEKLRLMLLDVIRLYEKEKLINGLFKDKRFELETIENNTDIKIQNN